MAARVFDDRHGSNCPPDVLPGTPVHYRGPGPSLAGFRGVTGRDEEGKLTFRVMGWETDRSVVVAPSDLGLDFAYPVPR